jgi:hypothetical protein
MSQAPTTEAPGKGYDRPRNIQFSVFIDNRVGQLLELVKIFDDQALQVAALTVIDSADYAVVRIITSNSDLARRLLKRAKQAFSETEVLVVDIGGEQRMTDMCVALLSVEINIHFAYPLLVRPQGRPAIAVHCDDRVLAVEVLLKRRFTLLGENDLGANATPGNEDQGI